MDANSIRALVEEDLLAHPGYANPHGVQVDLSLMLPTLQSFEDGSNDGHIVDLWLVLRETAAAGAGYIVVFDEARREFGLAVQGKRLPVVIGFYGSFTDALSAM